VLAVERDQQDEDQKLYAILRSLKCRITGETGEADTLKWNKEKGRYEVSSAFNAEAGIEPPHGKSKDLDGDIPF
jgi:hypothetical protein